MQFKLPKGEVQVLDMTYLDERRYIVTSDLRKEKYYLYRLNNGKFVESTKVRNDPLFPEVYPKSNKKKG
jgi:hypothetical protein